MEFELTADQRLFQETTGRFLDDTCPLTRVRELGNDPAGFDRTWWRQGAELGWTSMLVSEHLGGGSISDNGVRDLALASFERGRRVSPGPFVTSNVVAAAVSESDRSSAHAELLAGLIAGTVIATVAFDEPGQPWGVEGTAATLRSVDGTLRLDGVKSPVQSGAQADVFLVSARGDHLAPVLVLVPATTEGITVTPLAAVDLVQRFARVHFDGVDVDPAAVIAYGAAPVERSLDLANALQLAETVGAIDRVLEFTLEWAFDRTSFGRPLASYQELKHRFADMKLWLEASKATTTAALAAVGAGTSEASELVSAAKSYVSEHAPELVQDCVQIHGGIGVTWEHDLHLYLRRVTLNSSTFGTCRDHRERLATIILGED